MVYHITTPDGTADINDAAGTDQYLMSAPFSGKILVDQCYVRFSEATGSQSSAQGTIDLKVAGTTYATMTASISGAIGDTDLFVVDGTNATAANPWAAFSAGDAILFEIGTQASGGTVVGDGAIHIAIEYDNGV